MKIKKSKKVASEVKNKSIIEDVDVDVSQKQFGNIIAEINAIMGRSPYSKYNIESEHILTGNPGSMLGYVVPTSAYKSVSDLMGTGKS